MTEVTLAPTSPDPEVSTSSEHEATRRYVIVSEHRCREVGHDVVTRQADAPIGE